MQTSPPLELLVELSHPFEAELLRQVLERHEIACFVEGLNSASNLATKTGVGAIRLWVSAMDLPEARELLREAEQARDAAWYCERCGEWVGAGFEWCWKCGQPPSKQHAIHPSCHAAGSESEPNQTFSHDHDATALEFEDKISRAWRTSVIGLILLPVLLHIFSCVLLCQAIAMRAHMNRRQRYLFAGAWLINGSVFVFVATVLFYLLRG